MEVTAQALGLQLQVLQIRGADELEGAFDAAKTNTASKSNLPDTRTINPRSASNRQTTQENFSTLPLHNETAMGK
jgi:hypothetical protein